MIAAIYARKSTPQPGVSADAGSVARQKAQAQAFAQARGWTVDPAYVFEDERISGAEFINRPGFQALIRGLAPAPPFQALIVMELSRLGREDLETGYWVKQIRRAGVRIWSYSTGEEVQVETFEGRALYRVKGLLADGERTLAQQRAYETARRKATHGHVTGGVVF